ncbi:MAG: DUF1499 domain-containing protein [Pyrinomonadaceae bacterium]|nr:DUF1499 domain-containing protein [Pyrinomonadaceae bacterium]
MSIIKIIGIAAGAAIAGLAGLAVLNPGNVAETSGTPKEEALRTRRYKTDLEKFVAEAEKIIPTLTKYGQNWRFISTTADEKTATLKAEIPVVLFTDDLEIKAENDAGKGEIVVNIRSNSRVGKSDLGENRRHVLQLLAALDEKFGAK